MTDSPPMKHQSMKMMTQTVNIVDEKIILLRYNTPGSSAQRKMKRNMATFTDRLYDFSRNSSILSPTLASTSGGMSSTSGSCTPRCSHLNSLFGSARLPAIATKPEKQMDMRFDQRKG